MKNLLINILFASIALIAIFPASCSTRKASDFAINEDVFINAEGTRLFANIRGDRSSSPILLYLHGGPGNPLGIPIFKAYSGHQLEKDFMVVYLHQRGIMNSERIPNSVHTVSNYVKAIHYVVSYLKNHFKGKEIFLLGHSWGGFISYDYEENISVWLIEQKQIESILIEEILSINLTDSVRNLHKPLLCITGKEDTDVLWYIVKKEFENYSGPKEFILFENSHYMVFMDEEQLFVETVTNYLKGK